MHSGMNHRARPDGFQRVIPYPNPHPLCDCWAGPPPPDKRPHRSNTSAVGSISQCPNELFLGPAPLFRAVGPRRLDGHMQKLLKTGLIIFYGIFVLTALLTICGIGYLWFGDKQ